MIPLVWLIGSIGNILGLVVFSRKNMLKIGTVFTYKLLFVSDLLNMINMVNWYYFQITNNNLNLISDFLCKLNNYISFVIINLSPLLLVYISIEKIVSIGCPSKRFTLRKEKWQISYFLFVIAVNVLINSPILVSFKLNSFEIYESTKNQTNIIKSCDSTSITGSQLVPILYLVNKFIIPFSLMITCTILLIVGIVNLRKRIIQNFLSRNQSIENKKYQRDFRLSVTSLLLNIVFLILNAPVAVYINLAKLDALTTWFLVNLLYFSFALNFYLILISNHLARTELICIIKSLKKIYFTKQVYV